MYFLYALVIRLRWGGKELTEPKIEIFLMSITYQGLTAVPNWTSQRLLAQVDKNPRSEFNECGWLCTVKLSRDSPDSAQKIDVILSIYFPVAYKCFHWKTHKH